MQPSTRRITLLATLLLCGCNTDSDRARAPYQVVNDTIPKALTSQNASAEEGQAVFSSREAGHCVLCHQVSGLKAPFQGDLGPALTRVGKRLSPAQLRLRIVDASLLNPTTIMPPYYRSQRLSQVASAYAGQPALTALQIEQLVSYLSTLKD